MKRLFILFLFALNFYSCTKDTCNSVLGDTFLTIDTPVINQDSLGNPILSADMSTLGDLTLAYFDATTLIKNVKDRFGVEWQNDHGIVKEIKFTRENFKVQFNEVDLLNYGQVLLHFRLRDREEFIDCEHGGSGDSYFLNIQFSVQENSMQELEVINFQWEEEFSPGPF